MSLFSKPEVVILKESSDSHAYLEKLEALLPRTSGSLKAKIQKEISITRAGIQGEENILYELRNSGMDLYVLHDIYLEEGDLNAQIDFFIVTQKLCFVLECKNLYGNIEIDNKGNFIRTLEYGGKKHQEGIYSPITQNERHMNVIRAKCLKGKTFLGRAMVNRSFDSTYQSLVVLANPKTILYDRYAKKEIKDRVIRADQLIAVIRQMNDACRDGSYTKKAMRELARDMLSKNIEERKDYFQKFEELAAEAEENPGEKLSVTSAEHKKCSMDEAQKESFTDNKKAFTKQTTREFSENFTKQTTREPSENFTEQTTQESSQAASEEAQICPRCGGALLRKNGRYGEFWGCSSFPKCRFTKRIGQQAEIKQEGAQ